MRNIILTVCYDGSNYHGWQCQPNLLTIQEVLSSATQKIINHDVRLVGAARTDAGVHAFSQVVNFTTERAIALDGLRKGINSLLPLDIRVIAAREGEADFHARYSARSKRYIYTILNAPTGSPFLARYAWHVPYGIDVASMDRNIRILLGTHDFSAFKKKDESYRNPEREVLRAAVRRHGSLIHIILEATGFLRYMMRNVTGTILLVGSGKLTDTGFRDVLASGERERAGPTAPAHGLFLRAVRY
jgi:tRNA pseudouridine38-40 synthase